jgi:hypothetical protein
VKKTGGSPAPRRLKQISHRLAQWGEDVAIDDLCELPFLGSGGGH